MTVICQLHEAGWLLPVSYMRQVGCYLAVTWGRLSVSVSYMRQDIRLCVSYMKQDDGYL